MRKIVLSMSVSLDGFMEGPNREIGWHVVDEELHEHMNEWIGAGGAFLDGRVTYQLMAGFWPTADRILGQAVRRRVRPHLAGDAEARRLAHAGERQWNATVVHDVVPAEVMELKAGPGGDLLLGGADLAASFLRHDLVDEFPIYVHPILIGQGKALFHPSDVTRPLRTARDPHLRERRRAAPLRAPGLVAVACTSGQSMRRPMRYQSGRVVGGRGNGHPASSHPRSVRCSHRRRPGSPGPARDCLRPPPRAAVGSGDDALLVCSVLAHGPAVDPCQRDALQRSDIRREHLALPEASPVRGGERRTSARSSALSWSADG